MGGSGWQWGGKWEVYFVAVIYYGILSFSFIPLLVSGLTSSIKAEHLLEFERELIGLFYTIEKNGKHRPRLICFQCIHLPNERLVCSYFYKKKFIHISYNCSTISNKFGTLHCDELLRVHFQGYVPLMLCPHYHSR